MADEIVFPDAAILPTADFYLEFTGVAGGGGTGGGVTDIKTGGNPEPMKDLVVFAARAGVPLVRRGWLGSIKNVRGVNDAFSLLRNHEQYDPKASKLILYGYSAGAVNAMTLCRRFDKWNSEAGPDDKKVTVTLLVTVDAAAQEQTDLIDRSVGDCVTRNVNFWQEQEWTAQVLGWSRGAPNTCRRSGVVDNRQLSGKHKLNGQDVKVGHANIGAITFQTAKDLMQGTITPPPAG